MTVPAEWEDRNGHVNVQYYQTLYELGGYRILDEIGYDSDRLKAAGYGLFDIEHHLNYLAELIVGNEVSCFNRLLQVNPKRFHGVYFIVNDSTDRLACTLEYITAVVDLGSRRTGIFPPELLAGLERLCADGGRLSWAPPACGVMAP